MEEGERRREGAGRRREDGGRRNERPGAPTIVQSHRIHSAHRVAHRVWLAEGGGRGEVKDKKIKQILIINGKIIMQKN